MAIIGEFPIAGPSGDGTGDMLRQIYDPTGQNRDIFQYASLRNLGAAPRRNLLDNRYFVGGGSQRGGGQFPVNQRGKIIYDTGTVSGYGIDRWWFIFCNYNVTTGVLSHSTNQTYGGSMRQAVESPGRLAGRTVVMSILVDRVTGAPSISISKSSGMNSGMDFIGSTTLSNGLNTLVVNLPNDVGGDTYPILLVSINAAIGSSFRMIAAKLELGDTQTLAYRDEDGNWQLFETPDYAEELAKCQRYFVRESFGGNTMYCQAETALYGGVKFPTEMRTMPAVSNVACRDIFTGDSISGLVASLIDAHGFNAVVGLTGTIGHVYEISYEASAEL